MTEIRRTRESQAARILALLQEARGGEVPAPDLVAISLQYSARILELRRAGHHIVNRVEAVNGQRRGFFRLVAINTAAPARVQAPSALEPKFTVGSDSRTRPLFSRGT